MYSRTRFLERGRRTSPFGEPHSSVYHSGLSFNYYYYDCLSHGTFYSPDVVRSCSRRWKITISSSYKSTTTIIIILLMSVGRCDVLTLTIPHSMCRNSQNRPPRFCPFSGSVVMSTKGLPLDAETWGVYSKINTNFIKYSNQSVLLIIARDGRCAKDTISSRMTTTMLMVGGWRKQEKNYFVQWCWTDKTGEVGNDTASSRSQRLLSEARQNESSPWFGAIPGMGGRCRWAGVVNNRTSSVSL